MHLAALSSDPVLPYIAQAHGTCMTEEFIALSQYKMVVMVVVKNVTFTFPLCSHCSKSVFVGILLVGIDFHRCRYCR